VPDLKTVLRVLGLVLLGAGIAAVGVGAATYAGLSGLEPNEELLLSTGQGAAVFTVLSVAFLLRGRPGQPGWFVPVIGTGIIVTALVAVATPLLIEQGAEVAAVCVDVLEEAGVMFPITTSVAKEMGWLVLILFPLLLITLALDMLLMVFLVPVTLLLSPRVWLVGGWLLVLEVLLVLVAPLGAFGLMDLLRGQLFPVRTGSR